MKNKIYIQNLVIYCFLKILENEIKEESLLSDYFLKRNKLDTKIFDIEKKIYLRQISRQRIPDIFISLDNLNFFVIEILENHHIYEIVNKSEYQSMRVVELDNFSEMKCINRYAIWVNFCIDNDFIKNRIESIKDGLRNLIRVSYKNQYIIKTINNKFFDGMGETALSIHSNSLDNNDKTCLKVKVFYKELNSIAPLNITCQDLKNNIKEEKIKYKEQNCELRFMKKGFFTLFGLNNLNIFFKPNNFRNPNDISKINIISEALKMIVDLNNEIVDILLIKNNIIDGYNNNISFHYKNDKYTH